VFVTVIGMDAQAQRIVGALRAMFPEVLTIYRFGSAQRGDATGSSDVDVAILGPQRLDPVARWELEQRLAASSVATSIWSTCARRPR
jgi:predicted nucleotidyltransferase